MDEMLDDLMNDMIEKQMDEDGWNPWDVKRPDRVKREDTFCKVTERECDADCVRWMTKLKCPLMVCLGPVVE